MSINIITTTGAAWFWEQCGKIITEKALGAIKQQWIKFQWHEAEVKYRDRMKELHSTTRVLGYPKPIDIKDIYTDVYVLDTLTAIKRFDLRELLAKPLERDSIHIPYQRKSLFDAAISYKRLYLLGSPGSGKTTYLKYMIIQACEGKIAKTPVFVSLKEWSDSQLELIQFITQQFEICQFPEAQSFILYLLKTGKVFLMFDGLDEVSQLSNQRAKLISILANFAKRYPGVDIYITCRTAANEYLFDQFYYLEIAEFSDTQIYQYVNKWYQNDETKLERFIDELDKPEHEGLRELACTPLLLALLCLAYDEIGYFPLRRVDLYKEALDALLRKWDASRGIQRDDIYRKLSLGRKEQLLARLAAEYFENSRYFFKQEVLAEEITNYLEHLPPIDVGTDLPDGQTVLKAIEAQHGILVERAFNIYSFSHLTFQEYFTARYVVENSANGTIDRLIFGHFTDSRWHEVFLLTASLLYNADTFFQIFLSAIENLILMDEGFSDLLNWISMKALGSRWPGPSVRSIILLTIIDYHMNEKKSSNSKPSLDYVHLRAQILANKLASDNTTKALGLISINARSRIQHFDFSLNTASTLKITKDFGITFKKRELHQKGVLIENLIERLEQYLEANILLLKCLELAIVSDRLKLGDKLILPPEI